MKKLFATALAVAALTLQSCAHTPASPASQPLAMEEFMVPSDPGIQVYLRNKHPAGVSQFDSSKVVLYVHGATYPSETAFDLKLDGVSWDRGRGFDPATTTGGDGLRNLRERLAALGGACRIDSIDGAGTRVHLRLPLAGVGPR